MFQAFQCALFPLPVFFFFFVGGGGGCEVTFASASPSVNEHLQHAPNHILAPGLLHQDVLKHAPASASSSESGSVEWGRLSLPPAPHQSTGTTQSSVNPSPINVKHSHARSHTFTPNSKSLQTEKTILANISDLSICLSRHQRQNTRNYVRRQSSLDCNKATWTWLQTYAGMLKNGSKNGLPASPRPELSSLIN